MKPEREKSPSAAAGKWRTAAVLVALAVTFYVLTFAKYWS